MDFDEISLMHDSILDLSMDFEAIKLMCRQSCSNVATWPSFHAKGVRVFISQMLMVKGPKA